MPTRTRTPGRVLAVCVLLVVGAVGCAESTNTEADFDSWHDVHPVTGTTLVSRSATDSIFGHGEFTATYKLTATPSETTIRAAMRGACGFNDQTKADASYVLVAGKVTMEVACRPENQVKVAHFWTAVKDLPVTSMTFNQGQAEAKVASLPQAVAGGVLDTMIEAGTKDGLIGDGTFELSDLGGQISARTSSYERFGRQLEVIHALYHLAVPSSLRGVTANGDGVLVGTDLSPRVARALEDRANGDGERLLAVGSAKTTFNRLPPVSARDLIDALAERPSVLSVQVREQDWSVTVGTVDTAEALLTELADTGSPAASLGELQVVHAKPIVGRPGQVDTCVVGAKLPDVTVAKRLLPLCSIPDVTMSVVGDMPSVTTTDEHLPAVLEVLHGLPKGTQVKLSRSRPYDSLEMRVDVPLQVRSRNANGDGYEKQVVKAWKRLGPLP